MSLIYIEKGHGCTENDYSAVLLQCIKPSFCAEMLHIKVAQLCGVFDPESVFLGLLLSGSRRYCQHVNQ